MAVLTRSHKELQENATIVMETKENMKLKFNSKKKLSVTSITRTRIVEPGSSRNLRTRFDQLEKNWIIDIEKMKNITRDFKRSREIIVFEEKRKEK